MESLYILIPVALIFVAIAIAIYLWAVDSGQFKDLDKEAHSILFDNDQATDKPKDKNASDD